MQGLGQSICRGTRGSHVWPPGALRETDATLATTQAPKQCRIARLLCGRYGGVCRTTVMSHHHPRDALLGTPHSIAAGVSHHAYTLADGAWMQELRLRSTGGGQAMRVKQSALLVLIPEVREPWRKACIVTPKGVLLLARCHASATREDSSASRKSNLPTEKLM